MKYQFIEEHKHEFPIVVMCRVFTVSERGFYAWRKRPTCRRKQEDAHLIQEIQQVFEAHNGRYGSPRIHRDLRDEGIRCSRKRVARLMRAEELSARSKRHRVITTKRDETHLVAQISYIGIFMPKMRIKSGSQILRIYQQSKGGSIWQSSWICIHEWW